MRFMEISAFTGIGEISDLGSFYRARLNSGRNTIASAGTELLGYMCWPNDPAKRNSGVFQIREWLEYGEQGPVPAELRTIQQHWARVADIVHLHYDIDSGGHQQWRGGASLGKAIHLVSRLASAKGTGTARLWAIWKTYKDVAHLVTAAIIVAADMKERQKKGELALTLQRLLPFRVLLLMPEPVIGLAQTIERYGLIEDATGDRQPILDPDTAWRIPISVRVAPLPMPPRRLRPADLDILKNRRAGNRGKRQGRELTTPIL